MSRVAVTPGRKVVRSLAPIACVVILGLGAAACGSSSKTSTQNSPTSTAPVSVITTPKSGGAGF